MKKSSESFKRYYLFDNIKFFLIILMVIGHSIDSGYTEMYPSFRSLYLWIYIFHMPLFIFIAGMFHKNKNIIEKTIMYLFLGFAEKGIYFVANIISNNQTFVFSLTGDSAIPWFMFALAAYNCLSFICKRVNKKYFLTFTIFVALLAGLDSNIGDSLYLSRIIVFYPFYIMGSMVGPKNVIKCHESKFLKCISIVILLISIFCCFVLVKYSYSLRPFFTGRNPYPNGDYFKGIIKRLFCYASTLMMIFAFLILTPSKKIPVISKFGTKTIQVYFWSELFRIPIMTYYQPQLAYLNTMRLGKVGFILFAAGLAIGLMTKPFGIIVNQIANIKYIKNNSIEGNQ